MAAYYNMHAVPILFFPRTFDLELGTAAVVAGQLTWQWDH